MEQLTFGEEPAEDPAAGRAGGLPPAVTGYEIERDLAAAGARCVAGVDEVGRGAWAGPVTVCAVIVRDGFGEPPAGLTDSKRLSPRRRAVIAGQLPDWVEAFAIGEAGPAEIDAAGLSRRPAAVAAPQEAPPGHRGSAVPAVTGPAATGHDVRWAGRDEASEAKTTVELR